MHVSRFREILGRWWWGVQFFLDVYISSYLSKLEWWAINTLIRCPSQHQVLQ